MKVQKGSWGIGYCALTSAIDWGGWSSPRPGRPITKNSFGINWLVWMGPKARQKGSCDTGNFFLLAVIELWTVRHVVSRYSVPSQSKHLGMDSNSGPPATNYLWNLPSWRRLFKRREITPFVLNTIFKHIKFSVPLLQETPYFSTTKTSRLCRLADQTPPWESQKINTSVHTTGKITIDGKL
jgi:hypothetical protein